MQGIQRISGQGRRFLFLQGPHGPYFNRLGRMVAATGAEVWRVGFNRGDRAFWSDANSYIPYKGTLEQWPQALIQQVKEANKLQLEPLVEHLLILRNA